jgi:hypothetical protein
MMKRKFFPACILFFFCLAPGLRAQQDTEFWFVAPQLDDSYTNNYFNRPVYFVITAGDDPAVVTMEMPALAGFGGRTLPLAAHESQQILFGPDGSALSNLQMDTIQNRIRTGSDFNLLPSGKYDRGIRFTSTAPVTIYYQVDSYGSKDMFALKGSKALGTEFYTPFQTLFKTSSNYRYSFPQFHIVATEADTEVQITPAANVMTNAGAISAGATKTVYLGRGETFAVRAAAFMQDGRLAGSHIVSDKPVAVTVCDEMLSVGVAADMTGDQLVPVEGLGSAYVVIRGLASSNASYCDRVFILATQNGTKVSINGGAEQTIAAAGQQLVHSMPTDMTATIVSNYPVYVYQLSGHVHSSGGTEVGAVLLPSMYSIGSRRIIFDKNAAGYNHNVMVLVRNGSEDDFTVNGDDGVLLASDFATVPGMSDWKYTRKDISALVASGFVDVSNSTGAFSLGYFYTGSATGTSASFGYFSAYGTFDFPGGGITWLCGSYVVLAGGYAKSYEWYFNGNPIPGETGPSLVATEEGIYKVRMDQDGTFVEASTEVRRMNAGKISDNQYFCAAPMTSGTITVSVEGDEIPPDSEYRWESSPTGLDGSWTEILPRVNSPSYTPPPGLTETTYYRRGVMSEATTYCGWAYTDHVVIAVVAAGNIANGNQAICPSEAFAPLVVSGSQGDTFLWQWSSDGVNGWSDIPAAAGGTGGTYLPEKPSTPILATRTVWYRRGTASGACTMLFTPAVSMTLSPCVVPVNPHLRSRVSAY